MARAERLPPSNLDAETAILGACMVFPGAIEEVAWLRPGEFYKPAHAHVWEAMLSLASDGVGLDVVVVAHELTKGGLLESVGGKAFLLGLLTTTYSQSNLGRYALIVRDCARRRALIGNVGATVVEAAYDMDVPLERAVGELLALVEVADQDDLAFFVDPTAVNNHVEPRLLARADSKMLLYPESVHAFNGEPESMKSWLAAVACSIDMLAGHDVAYLDAEGSYGALRDRLRALRVPEEVIDQRLHYHRYDGPIESSHTLRRALAGMTLVVIDGVNDAMGVHGLDPYSNTDVAKFFGLIVRPAASDGRIVIVIDHVVKNREQQGRYAIGAQHKLAGIDVAVKVESVTPFGIERTGRSRLTLTKDRWGTLRGFAADGKRLGMFECQSWGDGGVTWSIELPIDTNSPFTPTILMQRVSAFLSGHAGVAFNISGLRAAVVGNNGSIALALNLLVGEGFVRQVGSGRGSAYEHIRLYTPPPPGTVNDDDEPETF